MTHENIRWEQRFQRFTKALLQLKLFIDRGDSLNNLEEQGMIQAFEYTYEMAWNTMKDYLNNQGPTKIQGSRTAFATALQFRLITDGDKWSQMVDDRNESSHSYDEEITEKLTGAIRENYYPLMLQFRHKMESILNGQQPSLLLNLDTK